VTSAQTIDEVIARLDRIIAVARSRGSRDGYFAALYKRVTIGVRDGIARGEFQDGARMARLDVSFANRYLDAHARREAGLPTTQCWQTAFDAAASWRPIVLQHLLLGINAHINLDLGIAAARTAPGAELPALRSDFERINTILAELTTSVRRELEQIWPLLRWVDALANPEEDAVIGFSMRVARDCAWSFAERLAPLGLPQQEALIADTDCSVSALGHLIRDPGLWLRTELLLVRLGERGGVAHIIDVLDRPAPSTPTQRSAAA
jgi:hypothetical protein